MKFTTTVLALLASVGMVTALPEAVAGGGGGWGGKHKGHLTSSCWTSSTCKATSYTETKTKTKPVTVTKTKTVYKPSKVKTEVPKTYTSTEYITHTYKTSSTYYETTTVKVPSKTYKTVCHTVPVETWTYSQSVCTETKYYPTSSVSTSYCPETTEVPSYYTTKVPYPTTYTSVTWSPYPTVCTETTTKCESKTGWKTWTAYDYGKGGW